MGLRFRKSISIAPGVKLNLSKSGVGISTGVKGLRVGVNSRGTYGSVGIPGTGIHYRTSLSNTTKSNSRQSVTTSEAIAVSYPTTVANPIQGEPLDLPKKSPLMTTWLVVSVMLVFGQPLVGVPSAIGYAYVVSRLKRTSKWQARYAFLAGQKAYKSKQEATALEKWREVLELSPDTNSLKPIVGALAVDHGQQEEGIKLFQQFLQVYPDDVRVKIALGRVLHDTERYDEGIRILQSLPQEIRQQVPVLMELASMYMDKSDYHLALTVLETGPMLKRNMDGDMVPYRYMLGRCYEEIGQRAKAVKQFMRVHAEDASFMDVEDRLKKLG